MNVRFHVCIFSVIVAAIVARSQDDSISRQVTGQPADETIMELQGKVTGLEESYLETKSTVDKLKKIKVSGYIQAQYRTVLDADTTAQKKSGNADSVYLAKYQYGVGDFSGGKFGDGIRNQFQIRRARVKVSYETELTTAVVQIDALPFSNVAVVEKIDSARADTTTGQVKNSVTSKTAFTGGGVSLKDAYLRFTEPWLKSVALKAGYFDRPFGFEIGYSSSSRESPERSRIFQTLFPGERDLGVALEYLGADNLPVAARLFNMKAGLFTGNGINVETDNNRDVIGRLGVSIPLTDINLAIDGGFSGYYGKVSALNDTVMIFDGGKGTFAYDGRTNKYHDETRRYAGGDAQIYLNIPVIGGFSLRGEYIQGVQPGAKASTDSPKSNIASKSPVYRRNFNGFYGMYVQNIDPINSQFVLKFDRYDPNIMVDGDDINAASKLTAAEIAYNTLGLGLVYHWDENVKLIVYWDHVMNEKVNADLATSSTMGFYTDDVVDDVLTVRIQYNF